MKCIAETSRNSRIKLFYTEYPIKQRVAKKPQICIYSICTLNTMDLQNCKLQQYSYNSSWIIQYIIIIIATQ